MAQASYQTGRSTTAGRVANKSAMATLPPLKTAEPKPGRAAPPAWSAGCSASP